MTSYLDHAATTPMLPEAVAAMAEEMTHTGNASSLHSSGRRARRVVEEAREQLGVALGAGPSEVVFTAGGTESDNLAVKGLYWARRAADPRRRTVVASPIEHHAVLDPVEWLHTHEQADVRWMPVDRAGRVDLDGLKELLDDCHDSVALVTVMWANNEVGTVQPIAEIAELAHRHGIPVHTDAIQAVGHLPVDFTASGVDCLSVSGHKLGGPVSSGALLARRGLDVVPGLHGGGQERGIRSGTLDVAALRAFAVATSLAVQGQEAEGERIAALRNDLVRAVWEAVPDAVLSGAVPRELAGLGPTLAPPSSVPGLSRLPGNAHFTFPGCEGDSLLYLLDARGVECSTGSACQAGVPQPSHVLLAMGVPETTARGALRFTLGHTSTASDVTALAQAIGPVVERARGAGLSSAPGVSKRKQAEEVGR
ncbi:cysteine desulfurase [Kineosporia rhizophila]|uniref:cysteine desulfurase family protein n=1 Tax=Kineosporia rhizophila TaxID=84633 RepID=UPI001E55E3A9|nr:cysteine desulfurase family protein [Kineosporia sp. NBRC 101677]MCE0537062.1 cysteine desulfurase [Kineosporia rhizophila]